MTVRIEPWSKADLPLLQKALGDPAMMVYLGGPESPEKIAERQARYEKPGSRQYRIVVDGEGAGWVGQHEFEWPPGTGSVMRCNDWRFDLFERE